MARHHAKTNHSHKSSQKTPEVPPPALQPSLSAAPPKQEMAPKQETAPKQAAPVQQEASVPQAEPTPAPVRAGPSDEQISRRAYEIFLARGAEHGRHDEDWQQAERELQLSR